MMKVCKNLVAGSIYDLTLTKTVMLMTMMKLPTRTSETLILWRREVERRTMMWTIKMILTETMMLTRTMTIKTTRTSGSMWRREVERRTPAPKQSRQEVEII